MTHTRSRSHSHPRSHRPATRAKRRRWWLSLALAVLTLATGQTSFAVEVRQGTCATADPRLDAMPGTATGPCYQATLPGAGYWMVAVEMRVETPFRRRAKGPRLVDVRFEVLVEIDRAGTYRICPELPRGTSPALTSAFLPAAEKEGDPLEIELEPDPSVTEVLAVPLLACDPLTKEGDPLEIELEPDP